MADRVGEIVGVAQVIVIPGSGKADASLGSVVEADIHTGLIAAVAVAEADIHIGPMPALAGVNVLEVVLVVLAADNKPVGIVAVAPTVEP